MRIPGIDYGAGRVQSLGREQQGQETALGRAQARAALAEGEIVSTALEGASSVLGEVYDRQVASDLSTYQTAFVEADRTGREEISKRGYVTSQDAAAVGIKLPKAADGSDRDQVPMWEVQNQYYDAWMKQRLDAARAGIVTPKALIEADNWSGPQLERMKAAVGADSVKRQHQFVQEEMKLGYDLAIQNNNAEMAEAHVYRAREANAISEGQALALLDQIPARITLNSVDRVLMRGDVGEMMDWVDLTENPEAMKAMGLSPEQGVAVKQKLQSAINRTLSNTRRDFLEANSEQLSNFEIRLAKGEVTEAEIHHKADTGFFGPTARDNNEARTKYTEQLLRQQKALTKDNEDLLYLQQNMIGFQGDPKSTKDQRSAEKYFDATLERYRERHPQMEEGELRAMTAEKVLLDTNVAPKSVVSFFNQSMFYAEGNPGQARRAVEIYRKVKTKEGSLIAEQLKDETLGKLQHMETLMASGFTDEEITGVMQTADLNDPDYREGMEARWKESVKDEEVNFAEKAAEIHGGWFAGTAGVRYSKMMERITHTMFTLNGGDLDKALETAAERMKQRTRQSKFIGDGKSRLALDAVEAHYPELWKADEMSNRRMYVNRELAKMKNHVALYGGNPDTSYPVAVQDRSKWVDGRPVYQIWYERDDGLIVPASPFLWSPDTSEATQKIDEITARQNAEREQQIRETAAEDRRRLEYRHMQMYPELYLDPAGRVKALQKQVQEFIQAQPVEAPADPTGAEVAP